MGTASPRVFISYTAEDLTAFADKAGEVLKRQDCTVVDHRFWPADDRKSAAVCRERVETSDIVVVIVAHRYGWRPGADQGYDGALSITELEYRWARTARKPVVAFMIKDGAPWDEKLIEERTNPACAEPLQRFKDELRGYVCRFFTSDINDFALSLSASLAAAKARLDAGAGIDDALSRPEEPAIGIALERNQPVYLCDRSEQSRQTLRTLFDHLNAGHGRPMLYVVHGDASQAHGSFVVRIESQMLPRVLGKLPSPREFETVTVNRIKPARYPEFSADFRSEFASKLPCLRLDSDAGLISWLQTSNRRRGVLITVELRTLECPDPNAALRAVHEYLQQFPDLPSPLFLVVVICVKYETTKATLGQRMRGWLTRASGPNELARAAVHALDVDGRGDRRAPVYALPELESVTLSDLDTWIAENRRLLRSHIANDDLAAIIGPTRYQSMDRVIKQLERLLEQQRESA